MKPDDSETGNKEDTGKPDKPTENDIPSESSDKGIPVESSVVETVKDVSDPASPLHRTDGRDVLSVSSGNAKYDFDILLNNTIIGNTKADVSASFNNVQGFEKEAKHRYRSSDPKIAKVDKNGVVFSKKCGEVDIILEQKKKGGSWTQIGSAVHLYIQIPEMEKKATVSIGDKELSAYKFLKHTTYSPTKWISTNNKVASIDDEGNIKIHKKGKTKIIASFGKGKTGSGKRYKTKLVISG